MCCERESLDPLDLSIWAGSMKLPTLDEFLTWRFPLNSYVDHPGFDDLYVRSQKLYAIIDDAGWYVEPVVQIGSVQATQPGSGAFTALVEYIVGLERAIYVENVHNPRFRRKLLELGFVEVNKNLGAPNYLFNFEGRLQKPEPLS